MTKNKHAGAGGIIEAHIEATTKEKTQLDLAASNPHLKAIIRLMPLLPDKCQRAVRVNVEALAALSV